MSSTNKLIGETINNDNLNENESNEDKHNNETNNNDIMSCCVDVKLFSDDEDKSEDVEENEHQKYDGVNDELDDSKGSNIVVVSTTTTGDNRQGGDREGGGDMVVVSTDEHVDGKGDMVGVSMGDVPGGGGDIVVSTGGGGSKIVTAEDNLIIKEEKKKGNKEIDEDEEKGNILFPDEAVEDKNEDKNMKINKSNKIYATPKTNGKRPFPMSTTTQMTLAFTSAADGESGLVKKMKCSTSPKITSTTTSSAAATAKTPTVGSLFACSVRTADSSLTSPSFDPSTVDATTITIANKQATTKGGIVDDKKIMLFEVLCDAFDKIEELKGSGAGSKKLASTVLANMFRMLIFYAPSQLAAAVYLCLNKVCPDYMGVEVGVGEGILIKCITTTYGRTDASIKQDIQKYEDLGAVAAASSCRVRTLFPQPRLTVASVFEELKAIANCAGQSSQQKKKDKISKLLVSAKKSEPKYIVRFLQQKMRIGVQTATLYQALAYAFTLTRPPSIEGSNVVAVGDMRTTDVDPLQGAELELVLCDLEKAVRAGLCEMPNIDHMVNLLLHGETAASLPLKCVITPGVPVQPMLAKPTRGIGEVLERFSSCDFTCEFKYDGERAQIHLIKPGLIKVFSRNLEDLTAKYPDIVTFIADAFQPDVQDCIVDSEVVAYDPQTDKILPFQILTTRKRKDVDLASVKVRVCVFAFDCMRHNGESLVRHSLAERRERLYSILAEVPSKVLYAKHKEMSSMEDVDGFLQDAVEGACEGLMVKTLHTNASYEPSKRSLNWLKLKKDYLDGSIADSLDLVPIGAFYGKGKRSKCYGAFLLAVWNADSETYQTVCKAGTGFSDEDLQEHYIFLSSKQVETKKPHYQVTEKMFPDVWFEACQVWECRAADLSLSPVHTSALGELSTDKGVGLRFPRFLRIRSDKSPEQATTSRQIVEMYESQFDGGGAAKQNLTIQEDEDYNEDE
eukprot:GHVS01022626.1.p1 GENE.GHVS01022626.1~~GHVS01022626.1.p1  ORF type:complete len:960 (-),score=181.51 GHVS01022626.1:749-3628(-)